MLGSMIARVRNYLYDRKWFDVYRSRSVVISVGNLTWGGTGKTSLVSEMCGYLTGFGFSVAIVSRGYGSQSHTSLRAQLEDQSPHDWRTMGDEPYLLSTLHPKTRVLVAANRRYALESLEHESPDVVILDDAFQHRAVARDLDLVLIDASEDLLGLRVLPFGKLREPVQCIHRADAIILTHSDRPFESTVDWIQRNARVPVFHARYYPQNGQQVHGKRVVAFCALGSPRHFYRSLEDCGAQVAFTHSFPDHYVYTRRDLENLQRQAKAVSAEAVVTSAKDAVKIDTSWVTMPLVVLKSRLKIEEPDFYEFMHDFVRTTVAENRSVSNRR